MAEILSLKQAVNLIPNGSMIYLGGMRLERNPMACCRELIRQNKTGIHLIGVLGGLAADMLAAGSVIERVELAEFTTIDEMDAYYLRKKFINGEIDGEIYSALAMCMRLYGGAIGVPFMPNKSMIKTDLNDASLRVESGKSTTVVCPYTSEAVNLVPSINPDVAVIHALKVDLEGNFIVGGPVLSDIDAFRASDIKIITAEEIVEKLPKNSSCVSGKFARPDVIIETKFGAWPTSVPDLYESDSENIVKWHEWSYQKYYKNFIKSKESLVINKKNGFKV